MFLEVLSHISMQVAEVEAMASHLNHDRGAVGGSAPWLNEDARSQLAAKVRALEGERERCVSQSCAPPLSERSLASSSIR